jgi:hypothetical protein
LLWYTVIIYKFTQGNIGARSRFQSPVKKKKSQIATLAKTIKLAHAALRRKSKDWLARNQDNLSEWGDMSIHELLFQ